MKKKMTILGLGFALLLGATVSFSQKKQGDVSDLSFINVEALASGESGEWITGYKTGEINNGSYTIKCCVKSTSTDSCNYGEIKCKEN